MIAFTRWRNRSAFDQVGLLLRLAIKINLQGWLTVGISVLTNKFSRRFDVYLYRASYSISMQCYCHSNSFCFRLSLSATSIITLICRRLQCILQRWSKLKLLARKKFTGLL